MTVDGVAAGPDELTPAQLSVLIARLSGIADEMGSVLQRGAFSPNIKERADCSAAVFDADGRMLAQAEHIPVHLGSMPASVAAVIAALGELPEGQQAIVNDPYAGGTHLNDITVVAPVWVGGGLVGWVANRAHHADVGGAAPGSLPADAVDIAQEGLRLPPMRLTDEVRELLFANSRTGWERSGDLDAQLGANVVGARRLADMISDLGTDALAEVIRYGERRCRAALEALPVGEWSAEDAVDSVGSSPEQQRPATLRCTVRVEADSRVGESTDVGSPTEAGRRITFDLRASDPQSPGNMNAVRAVTVSAVAFVLRSVLDPTLPANDGVMAPVAVLTEPGTIVDAAFPAAVGAGNVEISQRVLDVCMKALAQAEPERVPAASQGTMNNLLVGGDGWVYYETVGGGQGGRPQDPRVAGATPVAGQSAIQTGMTNTLNTPIEAFERSYPMRIVRYRIRSGTGGAGAAPGGDGIERDIEMLEDVTVSLITERRMSQPWGLQGGESGATGENWLLPADDESRSEHLPDKCTLQLKAGDVLRMLTPGGGGWGGHVSGW